MEGGRGRRERWKVGRVEGGEGGRWGEGRGGSWEEGRDGRWGEGRGGRWGREPRENETEDEEWKEGRKGEGRGEEGEREEEGGRKDCTLVVWLKFESGFKQSGSQPLACAANYPITADAF